MPPKSGKASPRRPSWLTKRRRTPTKRRILIDPRAVEAFAARELDDWRWIKEVPEKELWELVPKGFDFPTAPKGAPQLACFVLGMKHPRFNFLLDMGGGKSWVVLQQIRYRKFLGELQGALIVVPYLINIASWEAQLQQHAPDLTYTLLEGSRGDREKLLEAPPTDVYVINQAGLGVLMAGARKRTRKGTLKRTVVLEDALAFRDRFNFLALDELHLYLSKTDSLLYQLAQMLSWGADFCYGMTGTPMGKDPTKLWPQLSIVDKGETLGQSLAMYHAVYFVEKESRWTYSGIEYVFNPRKKLALNRAIQHRSIRYTSQELRATSTSKPISIPIPVRMSPAQIQRYETLVKEAREAREEGEHGGNVFVRARQTIAGFIALNGEDTGRLEIEFSPNPKADALESLIQQLGEDKKVVVFHSFVYSGKIIRARLDKMKVKYSGVGQGFTSPGLQLKRFLTDPKCRVFIANCQAGGTGVDGLQSVCHYAIFYESPTPPDLRAQAEKRLDREGQKNQVYIYDLVAQGIGVDRRVLESIAKGNDLFSAVLDGKEKAL